MSVMLHCNANNSFDFSILNFFLTVYSALTFVKYFMHLQ